MSTKEDILYFPGTINHAPLAIELAGVSYCDGSYAIHRINPPILVIEYVEKGYGTLEIGGVTYTPRAGDVYIVPPWREQSYFSSADDPWVKHWVNLMGVLPETLLHAYGLSETYLFKNAEKAGELIVSGVRTLRELPDGERIPFMELRLHEIIQALAELRRSESEHAEESEVTKRVLLFLHARIQKPMPDLAAIAEAAQRSPAQTIRIFRRDTGMTPYHYLLREKMSAAEKLLRNSHLRVADIARATGFRDEYYFSRLYRQFKGCSPRETRNA